VSRVDQMMAVAQPLQHRDRWRREAFNAMQRVLSVTISAEPAAKAKKQLEQARRQLAKARILLRAVRRNEPILADMQRVEREIELEARRLKTPPSGGSRASRLNAAKARIAAELAYDLLCEYGRIPTLTRNGKYLRLTEVLIGRASIDTIERACRRHVARLRTDGVPTVAEFRRMRLPIVLPSFPSLRAQRVFRSCLINALEQYEAQAQRRQNRIRSAAS
jgi:hypothetical protein